ncbi:MarR family winged helix-turn-helix transcriptional regulator [Paracoccus aurantiacus]|nr:MarR family transcriptional regulator [Paracoccus aurantiacus]
MKDFDYQPLPNSKVELGYLAGDLTFMTRVLSAHIRVANVEFQREWDTVSGSLTLLSLIGLNPEISQNDLAAVAVMKKSAVTKIVTDLEERGLVIRDKHKSDRRFNALTLSPEGEAFWKDMRKRSEMRHEHLLHPLSARDREKLFSLLGRLIAHYSEDRSGSRSGASIKSH